MRAGFHLRSTRLSFLCSALYSERFTLCLTWVTGRRKPNALYRRMVDVYRFIFFRQHYDTLDSLSWRMKTLINLSFLNHGAFSCGFYVGQKMGFSSYFFDKVKKKFCSLKIFFHPGWIIFRLVKKSSYFFPKLAYLWFVSTFFHTYEIVDVF